MGVSAVFRCREIPLQRIIAAAAPVRHGTGGAVIPKWRQAAGFSARRMQTGPACG